MKLRSVLLSSTYFKRGIILTILLIMFSAAQSQILIALVFGDKLNSPNLGFGLNVGTNFAYTPELNSENYLPALEMGLFLDIRMHDRFILRPEMYFKRAYKMQGMNYYVLPDNSDPELQAVLEDTEVMRKMNYMGIGCITSTRLIDYFYFDFGPDIQLLRNAKDIFTYKPSGDYLEYQHTFKEDMPKLDFGLAAGISYRLKDGKGMAITARYRHGFAKYDYQYPEHNNRGFILEVGIPINSVSKEKEKI